MLCSGDAKVRPEVPVSGTLCCRDDPIILCCPQFLGTSSTVRSFDLNDRLTCFHCLCLLQAGKTFSSDTFLCGPSFHVECLSQRGDRNEHGDESLIQTCLLLPLLLQLLHRFPVRWSIQRSLALLGSVQVNWWHGQGFPTISGALKKRASGV